MKETKYMIKNNFPALIVEYKVTQTDKEKKLHTCKYLDITLLIRMILNSRIEHGK